MLYGFADGGRIIITAADLENEFGFARTTIEQSDLEFEIPSPISMVTEPGYHGLTYQPIVITGGTFTGPLRLVTRAEAIDRQRAMLQYAPDDVDSLATALFDEFKSLEIDDVGEVDDGFIVKARAQAKAVQTRNIDRHDAAIASIPKPSEFLFSTYAVADVGTLMVITSAAFYDASPDSDDVPIYANVFQDDMRIGASIRAILPDEVGEEILPGVFTVALSPLAARRLLVKRGFDDRIDYVRTTYASAAPDPDADTTEDIAKHLAVRGRSGTSFLFGAVGNAKRQSTYVAITSRSFFGRHGEVAWDCFISPLVLQFMPGGYAELAPGVFEVFREISQVEAELKAKGFARVASLTANLRRGLGDIIDAEEAPSDINDTVNDVIRAQWDVLEHSFEHKTKEEKDEISANLSPSNFHFCINTGEKGNHLIVIVPKLYFESHQSLFPHYLGLEHLLIPGADHVIDNIYRIRGTDPLVATEMLVRAGFIESFSLTLWFNIALYENDYVVKLGL